MSKRPSRRAKANENKAKDVETKPIPPTPSTKPIFYALSKSLRQLLIQALLTSSPKQLNVMEINQLCSDLERLRPIIINEAPNSKKEDTNDKKT